MTLIAAQIDNDRLEILADGLSCHSELTITPSRQLGLFEVRTNVPGRTTLQKIFPHPQLAFAIAHVGDNQRDGVPVRTIVEHCWDRAVSHGCLPGALERLIEDEFGGRTTAETILLFGWQAPGMPFVRAIGSDCERLSGRRYWAGSGRMSLSTSWSDLDMLQDMAECFHYECQEHAPFDPPVFANCYGGHWHRLQLRVNESPQWLVEPRRTGVEVSALLPGPLARPSGGKPADEIVNWGERLKVAMRKAFNVKTVRGALKRCDDDNNREQLARLIAIFDEVQLDASVATVEDARRYVAAVTDAMEGDRVKSD